METERYLNVSILLFEDAFKNVFIPLYLSRDKIKE